jgi:predicted ribosomally synthesized peptide with nif11-like leader
MSTESVRQFLLAVSSESALHQKLAAVTDSVNFVQMVQECGYSFTLEDLQAHVAQHNNGELSEDELEAVAGGNSLDIIFISSSVNLAQTGALGGNGSIPIRVPGPRPGPGPGPLG